MCTWNRNHQEKASQFIASLQDKCFKQIFALNVFSINFESLVEAYVNVYK